MGDALQDLLIIYESEAEQWATYMRSVLAGPIPESNICCYDIAKVNSRRDDFLRLGGYKCKLLILSTGMLEGLCQLRRFFLARVLHPSSHVVVLLCGVESLVPLLELVPLKGDECLQISSEQDAQDYVSAVAEIVKRGEKTSPHKPATEDFPEKRKSTGALTIKPFLLVLPSRVSCENPGEIFILLREAVASKDAEVEFSSTEQRVKMKPVNWNDFILSVNAADFPPGNITVTLYCGGVVKGKARVQYYNTMGEITRLLKQAADPVDFMCQAFQVSSVEKLDQTLTVSLMQKMPVGAFQGLQTDLGPTEAIHSEDIPTLLHLAAQHGLRGVASVLLQCPGAQQALRTANRHGHTPLELAQRHGHTQLHILLQETLVMNSRAKRDDETSVYEMMGTTPPAGRVKEADGRAEEQSGGGDKEEDEDEDEEDPYAPLGINDEEYDTILTANNPVVIANRPPAPAPRPETLPTKEDSTPVIARVFQKKMSQGDTDTLYSLPTKQARGRDSISSTYDTFVPSQPPGLEELIELQEKVKRGSLTMDEALERFSDWQRVQRGLDAIQQEKLRQLRASIINNREDDDGVYDKISIIHHTPNVNANNGRRVSQTSETEFYSKPLKGQHSNLFGKADKQ
ncbi:B-cell scaffold protein with ankyrin repeats-like [Chanos chanos]|uniref:B-cell scaffold protein with ankyrin repeats-like n=1 Tax=Chanos chanos TaxID=29144 RepID=A0A6J2VSF0_CHACN|nr:B-cell scaffold protein with ankyrin repeats [Chanos chanos]